MSFFFCKYVVFFVLCCNLYVPRTIVTSKIANYRKKRKEDILKKTLELGEKRKQKTVRHIKYHHLYYVISGEGKTKQLDFTARWRL